ncbi:serine carboxypeptidase-like 7 isoform X2 [Andrographis paniculata]|uniref:serine carboxypeptidase-like 7 isoform X2 n=1 Tax=Andrographis paniculata TaxID=175694 RepID=UPI0021E7C82C|nr:serine carboxypeptidase-like 7 isoform X2 [Andrographis paniculata]
MKLLPLVSYLLIFLVFATDEIRSQSAVPTLPGFDGPLPFNLQTGYIGVGENEEVQLFYYFVESEGNPNTDPLFLWLTGGPGCSAFSGLVYEIGPFTFDQTTFDGSLPSLIINPYSWTKVASIIFIDSPVGTGFSYATTAQAYASSETIAAQHNYMFLTKWLDSHPSFRKNRLYITGDSHGGKIAPMVALAIARGNEAGTMPRLLLQGYIVGNSLTDNVQDENERIPYYHRMALISDEYFELAKSSCNGRYTNPDPNNVLCLYALELVDECVKNINTAHILEPKCKFRSPKPDEFRLRELLFEDDPIELISLSKSEVLRCRNDNYESSYAWMNNETVREALHIRKGTISDWKRCNKSLSYEQDVESILEVHRLLSEKGFQALAYSGDHDGNIPYLSTLKWIRQLNLTVDSKWRPWTVDGQVAGYTEVHQNNQAFLTFATVKGAGHTAPEYKPKECLEMIKRWLAWYPL